MYWQTRPSLIDGKVLLSLVAEDERTGRECSGGQSGHPKAHTEPASLCEAKTIRESKCSGGH